MKKICVYCGSSSGERPEYRQAAKALGQAMGERGIDLVYGGAAIGIMGQIADTVLGNGGKVTGVIPTSLVNREISHQGLTELVVVDSMHERKSLMAELSDGFIALPGGIGTLEEIFEVLTWAQLGFHEKPCALLNVAGYYDHLASFLTHAFDQGFIKKATRAKLMIQKDPALLLDLFEDYQVPLKQE